MTTTLSTRAPAPMSVSVRTGLALSVVLGAGGNFPFLFIPKSWWGHAAAPPYGVLLVNSALGLVSVVAAVIVWRSGNRVAIMINGCGPDHQPHHRRAGILHPRCLTGHQGGQRGHRPGHRPCGRAHAATRPGPGQGDRLTAARAELVTIHNEPMMCGPSSWSSW